MNNNKHLLNCDKIRIETYQGYWFGVFRIVAATDVIHGTQLALANGRNIVGQRLPTLLNVTLRPFVHPVASCFVLLGVVAQSLKPVKLLATCKRIQH